MKYFLILFFFLTAPLFAGTFSVYNRIVYSSTNVTTGAWVQIVASTPNPIETAVIFDSSGQTLELGTGASGQEVSQMLIPPGGGSFPVSIGGGTRLSIRAVSATANTGEGDFNLFYK